jgi:hypothetical protein
MRYIIYVCAFRHYSLARALYNVAVKLFEIEGRDA